MKLKSQNKTSATTAKDICTTEPFSIIRQGVSTNTLTKLKDIKGETTKIDPITGTATITKGNFTLTITNYEKLAGIKTSTYQLLDAITIALTVTGAKSPTVIISLEEYMQRRCLKDRKEAKKQVKADIEILKQASITGEEKLEIGHKKEIVSYSFVNIADSGEVRRNGDIVFTFDNTFYQMLLNYPVMPYPAQLQTVNNKRNPSSYYFLRKIAEHKNINIGKKNEDIIAVKTLLEASPFIPSYSDVMSKDMAATRKIIEPFERDIDVLNETLRWNYCHSNGEQLKNNKLNSFTYDFFASLFIKINWKKYPKNLKEELDRIQYDILPTSSSLYLFNTALTYHNKKKNIPTTKNGTKQSDRHKEISYSQANGGGYTITQTDKMTGEQVELTLTNTDKMQEKGVKKCFAYLLTMSNKQNFRPVIGFSLQELVDRGMYKNLDAARLGLKNALDTLQNIKFSGTIKNGKKKEIKQAAEAGILFYHYKIKNNYVEVSVNENFNIEFIAAYYALFPQFAYRLSNSNAFDLCEYIFMRARQNTAKIKNDSSFNISFKKIRELLALPTDKEIENCLKRQYTRYIIDPILTAINDIQQEAAAANNTGFIIQAVYNSQYKNCREFLEGYIQISFNGELYSKLSEIAEKKETKIAQTIAIKGKKKIN